MEKIKTYISEEETNRLFELVEISNSGVKLSQVKPEGHSEIHLSLRDFFTKLHRGLYVDIYLPEEEVSSEKLELKENNLPWPGSTVSFKDTVYRIKFYTPRTVVLHNLELPKGSGVAGFNNVPLYDFINEYELTMTNENTEQYTFEKTGPASGEIMFKSNMVE